MCNFATDSFFQADTVGSTNAFSNSSATPRRQAHLPERTLLLCARGGFAGNAERGLISDSAIQLRLWMLRCKLQAPQGKVLVLKRILGKLLVALAGLAFGDVPSKEHRGMAAGRSAVAEPSPPPECGTSPSSSARTTAALCPLTTVPSPTYVRNCMSRLAPIGTDHGRDRLGAACGVGLSLGRGDLKPFGTGTSSAKTRHGRGCLVDKPLSNAPRARWPQALVAPSNAILESYFGWPEASKRPGMTSSGRCSAQKYAMSGSFANIVACWYNFEYSAKNVSLPKVSIASCSHAGRHGDRVFATHSRSNPCFIQPRPR